MYGNYHFFPKQLWQPCKKCRSLSVNVHYIIFSKCTVKSCKKRRTHSCKPFFLDSRNIFLTDSFIFCFIVILCTTHMMAGTVITGDCTAILHHSGAKFFCYNFNSAFSAQPLLTEHRDCQFSFHIIRILLSSVLSSLS